MIILLVIRSYRQLYNHTCSSELWKLELSSSVSELSCWAAGAEGCGTFFFATLVNCNACVSSSVSESSCTVYRTCDGSLADGDVIWSLLLFRFFLFLSRSGGVFTGKSRKAFVAWCVHTWRKFASNKQVIISSNKITSSPEGSGRPPSCSAERRAH